MSRSDWTYPHRSFDEPQLPDGTMVIRPAAPVAPLGSSRTYHGVLDSGAPLSVCSTGFARLMGALDAEPVMHVPLGLGGRVVALPVHRARLRLLGPLGRGDHEWDLEVAVRDRWTFPFALLLGQRGWFDTFATTIDGDRSVVHLPLRPPSAAAYDPGHAAA